MHNNWVSHTAPPRKGGVAIRCFSLLQYRLRIDRIRIFDPSRYAALKVRGGDPRDRVPRASGTSAPDGCRPAPSVQVFLSGEVVLPRKEVIQPHVPVRLPCYDFTPLTLHTFDASAPLRGSAGGFGCRRLGWCDGRCVQGPGTYSPRRADPRLLATPASRRRVAACDPNWGRLLGSAPPRGVATHCAGHCSTCAAQGMRGMMT